MPSQEIQNTLNVFLHFPLNHLLCIFYIFLPFFWKTKLPSCRLNYTFINVQEFLPVIPHPWKPEKTVLLNSNLPRPMKKHLTLCLMEVNYTRFSVRVTENHSSIKLHLLTVRILVGPSAWHLTEYIWNGFLKAHKSIYFILMQVKFYLLPFQLKFWKALLMGESSYFHPVKHHISNHY